MSQPYPTPPSDTATDPLPMLPRVRLLVIEDDPDQQELVAETLEDQFGVGCVDIAGTCAKALATSLADYDLILCDVNLPDGNGLDLLAELLARTDRPVMMLTGEQDTATAREAIRRGATDYVVKTGAYLATMPLTVEKNLAAGNLAAERESANRQLRDHADQLARDLDASERSRRDAEQLASTDPMTGCYNRRAFEQVFAQLFAEAYRNNGELAAIMIDLDDFKEVNDTHGHVIGDEVVRLAARSIRTNLRQMDVVCRFGGDEFIVLLPQTDSPSAAGVADRVRRDYGQSSASLLKTDPRTMSIGIATLRTTSPIPANPEALLVAADRALYQAKEGGRNQIYAAA